MHFSATLIAALASGALALPGGYGEKTPVYDAAKATSCTEEQGRQTYPPSNATYDAPPPKNTYYAPSKDIHYGDEHPESKPVYNPSQPRPVYPWSSSVSTYAPSKPSSGPVHPGDDKPVHGPVYPGDDKPSSGPVYPGDDKPSSGPVYPGDDKPVHGPVYPGDDKPVHGPVYPGDDKPVDDGEDDGSDDVDDPALPEVTPDLPEVTPDLPEVTPDLPEDGGDPIADPISNDSTSQATQCGNGNAVSCCNSANSAGLLGNVLGGSCSIQIPILAGALGNGCKAANTFCCPTNQNGSINIALPCIPINL